MGVELFVTFDNNPQGIFYAGQRVTGFARGRVTEPLKARGITLQYCGKVNTSWNETEHVNNHHNHHHHGSHNDHHGHASETVHVRYASEDVLFNQQVNLWGNPGFGNDSYVMAVGEFAFPFVFDLPPNLPSSFEGIHGNIRYFVKVTVDRPWRFNIHCKSMFTVVAMIDLNANPMLVQPCTAQAGKEIGVLCCKSGQMSCQVRIPRGGYVGGEAMPFDMDITNDSTSVIKRVEANLVQTVAYSGKRHAYGASAHGHHFGGQKTKTVVKNVATLLYNQQIPGGESRIWQGTVQIPALPPSSGFMANSIINVTYALLFTVAPSGVSFNFHANVPITIGSIPLRQVFSHFQQAPMQPSPSLPSAQPSAPPPAFMASQYPDLPPPSYAEATGDGPIDARDEMDTNEKNGQLVGGNASMFAPAYPTYMPSAPPMCPPQQY